MTKDYLILMREASMGASFLRRAAALALALLIALQAGCASDHDKSAEATAAKPSGTIERPFADFQPGINLGTVAIVTVAELPDTLFGGPTAKPRAADGFRTCGNMLTPSGSSNDKCTGPQCALFYAGMIVAVVAVCGTLELVAQPSALARNGIAPPAVSGNLPMPPVVNPTIVQDALRDQIVAAAKARSVKIAALQLESAPRGQAERFYRALAAKGVDTVLEVELTQVLASNSYDTGAADEVKPSMPLEMKVHARLFRAGDSELLYQRDYAYRGKNLRYDEWTANHAQKLVNEVRRGYETLARDISDSLLIPDFNHSEDK